MTKLPRRLLLVAAFAPSCAPPPTIAPSFAPPPGYVQETLEVSAKAFVGQPASLLIKEWGAPASTGREGEYDVWLYRQRRIYREDTVRRETDPPLDTIESERNVVVFETRFWVDAERRIVRYRVTEQ